MASSFCFWHWKCAICYKLGGLESERKMHLFTYYLHSKGSTFCNIHVLKLRRMHSFAQMLTYHVVRMHMVYMVCIERKITYMQLLTLTTNTLGIALTICIYNNAHLNLILGSLACIDLWGNPNFGGAQIVLDKATPLIYTRGLRCVSEWLHLKLTSLIGKRVRLYPSYFGIEGKE